MAQWHNGQSKPDLTFSYQISSLSLSLVIKLITFVNFVVSARILTSKLPVPLPYLLFISKLDYCNCLYYNLPKSQTNRLQVIQNSLAQAVVKARKFCHITPILKSLHWLKVNEHIEYKLLSLTYKAHTTAQPTYLHSLISVQPSHATRSSSVFTLSRPRTSSSLGITNRPFSYASPRLWNLLPVSLRQPCTKHPADDDVTLSNSPPTCSPLSPSITHSLFHSRLKTHLFHKSFPP